MAKLVRDRRVFWMSFDGETWTPLGKGMDSLSMDTNPETDQTKDVLGNVDFNHNGYTPSITIEYKANSDEAIYTNLQEIVDTLAVDEETITAQLIVATLAKPLKDSNASTVTGSGYKTQVRVVVNNDGGDTSAYTIPFTAYEYGTRTQGTVSVSEQKPTFTAATAAASLSD